MLNSLNIFSAAAQYGDAPALIFEHHVYTFNEMARRCRPVCEQLNRLPASATPTICGRNHPHTVFVILAALQCQRPIAIHHQGSNNNEIIRLHHLIPGCYPAESSTVSEWIQGKAGAAEAVEEIPPPPTVANIILFTSGTSTAPRGVMLSERALVASARASERNLGWRSDDCWIVNLPLAHIGGLSIVFRCLLAGKPAILHPRFREDLVFHAITSQGATMISLVPTTLQRLMASPQKDQLKKLRVILLGGAAAPESLRTDWQQMGLPVVETYGMTETASQAATVPLNQVCNNPHAGLLPVPGTAIHIIDETGTTLPRNTTGRIRISGPTVMTGYVGRPPCSGTFITADRGFLDNDGCLHVLGRMDNIIITGGENVQPEWVEAQLKTIRGITEAVVFGVDDVQYGQIVACALYVDRKEFDETGLDSTLRRHLAPHQKPRQFHIAPHTAIPLLENGKLNRRAIINRARLKLTSR